MPQRTVVAPRPAPPRAIRAEPLRVAVSAAPPTPEPEAESSPPASPAPSAPATPVAPAPTQLPGPAMLDYRVSGSARGIPFEADAQLIWRPGAGRYTADYALRLQRDRLAAVFDGMDDAYLKSRMDDLDHVIGRIHAHLHQRATDTPGVAGEVLVSDNVAPSELAELQQQGVVAVVTAAGSALSHSAILARSLHLPLVVGNAQALQRINDGDVLLVDGSTGEVVVNPDPDDLRRYRERLRALGIIEFGDRIEDRQCAAFPLELAHADISASRKARALRQSRRRVRSLIPSIPAISISE